ALADGEVAALQALDLPVIGLGVPRGELPTLRVDDTAVGRAATEHLLALGHRAIAHIGQRLTGTTDADPDLDIPTRRSRGFEQAMADAAAAGDAVDARFEAADFTIEGGRLAAQRLLERAHPPTAIFAASDEMAYGVLTAARERGISVPRDLSVIGVDGHDMADLFGLTTIDQFPHAQGERAGDAILAVVDGGTEAPETIPARDAGPPASLPFELVVRATTGPRT
ncbi:MAG TPA: substrate-binding domain-containing protein, partial [Microbacterium sp.]|nr:substrate-binding domain-containing protein [Microbacterium sp.]